MAWKQSVVSHFRHDTSPLRFRDKVSPERTGTFPVASQRLRASFSGITPMTYTGTVQNGAVILPADAHLPNGTAVEVRPLASVELDTPAALTDALLEIASRTRALPSDLAARHDHYLRGHPKA